MDGRRFTAVIARGGAEQNPAYRPAHPIPLVLGAVALMVTELTLPAVHHCENFVTEP